MCICVCTYVYLYIYDHIIIYISLCSRQLTLQNHPRSQVPFQTSPFGPTREVTPQVKLAKALPAPSRFPKLMSQILAFATSYIDSSLQMFQKVEPKKTHQKKNTLKFFFWKYRPFEGTTEGSSTHIENAGKMPVLTIAPESSPGKSSRFAF